jgi:hypothetical protein
VGGNEESGGGERESRRQYWRDEEKAIWERTWYSSAERIMTRSTSGSATRSEVVVGDEEMGEDDDIRRS